MLENSISAQEEENCWGRVFVEWGGREWGALGGRLHVPGRKLKKGLLVSYVVWCVHGRSSGITDSQ